MLTDATHQAYQAYLRTLADQLGLKDWTIKLERERPSNPNHNACVRPVYGRKRAQVWVCEAFFTDSVEEQRQTMVHELVHLHINPVRNCLDNGEQAMGQILYRALLGSMDDALELAVDGLADIIAPSLPLPPVYREEPA